LPIIGAPSPPAGGTAEFNAWLAGMFDGEGHVGFSRKHAVRLCITNTFAPVLFEIQLTLGYGSIKTTQTRSGWHTRYDWRTSHREEVADFINRVKPYLRIKHDEILRAEERITATRNARAASMDRTGRLLELVHGGMSPARAGRVVGISQTHSYRLSRGA